MGTCSTKRARAAGALLAALALLATGCSQLLPARSIEGHVLPPAAPPGGGGFRVGAARVDLTPIPGIPMSYSFDGKMSRGFWTRLYARAIYLEDAGDNAIVLVACELAAIPNGLRDRVAHLVRNDPKTAHLGRAQIVLAATHTHHGPQNFFSSRFYNSMPSQRVGFDPQLFEHLAERIKTAIVDAVGGATAGGDVRYRDGKLERFFRNRSIEAFLLNEDRDAFLGGNASIAADCHLVEGETDPWACQAVRSVVEVVDFFDAFGAPIATAVFLAAHPTVMSPDTEVFTGDLFGATSLLLEQGRMQEACGSGYSPPPVVAVFNGAEGDASISWSEEARDRVELETYARQLAEFVCGKNPGVDASPPIVQQDPVIQSRFAWPFELAGRSASDPAQPCEPWRRDCTVTDPRPGVPSMGGAQDGRTVWYEAGAQPGLRAAARAHHGRKAVGTAATGFPIMLSGDLAPKNPDLEQVPLGVYWIGSLVIATLPGEFTTMMGDRIRRELRVQVAVPDPAKKQVLLIGLGNGRVSYVTTPEEYDAQHYEGAQNLFGAATGPLIQAGIVAVGKSTSNAALDPDYAYSPGVCRVFLPSDAGLPGYLRDDGLEDVLSDAVGPRRDRPHACWIDAIPKLSKIPSACERAIPYVWIEPVAGDPGAQCTSLFGTAFLERPCDGPRSVPNPDPRLQIDGIALDNCGTDLVTVLDASYDDRTRWCAYWTTETELDPSEYRFCVAGVTGANVMQIPGSTEAPKHERALDEGKWYLPHLIERHLECGGLPTRQVCEYPSELP